MMATLKRRLSVSMQLRVGTTFADVVSPVYRSLAAAFPRFAQSLAPDQGRRVPAERCPRKVAIGAQRNNPCAVRIIVSGARDRVTAVGRRFDDRAWNASGRARIGARPLRGRVSSVI